MQVCLWDLKEGRSELVESLWTGTVGFCQCSLLETGPTNYLLAFAGQQTEEVRYQQGKRCFCQLPGHVGIKPLQPLKCNVMFR